MLKSLVFILLSFAIFGCTDNSLDELRDPPVSAEVGPPTNMVYATIPFLRDFNPLPPDQNSSNEDLRSCPNGSLSASDELVFSQDFSYRVNIQISDIYPCYHGREASLFAISPDLPEGLFFSELSGRISGTPLQAIDQLYTITALNSSGSTTSSIQITVTDNLPIFSYTNNSIVLTQGSDPVIYFPQIGTSSGDITWSISPSNLPSGFSFNTNDGSLTANPVSEVSLSNYIISGSTQGNPNPVEFTLSITVNSLIRDIDLGSKHACIIKNEEIRCWGDNSFNQIKSGIGLETQNAVSIDSFVVEDFLGLYIGNKTSCITVQEFFIPENVTYCWGENSDGQIPYLVGTNFSSPQEVSGSTGSIEVLGDSSESYIDLESHNSFLELTTSGDFEIKTYGEYSSGNYSGSNNYVEISSGIRLDDMELISDGGDHSCGLNESGAVYCWGNNSLGQSGHSGSSTSFAIINSFFDGIANIAINIDSGQDFSCSIDSLNDVYCWGNNSNNQLGNNTIPANTSMPVTVNNLPSSIESISVGTNNSCVVSSGKVYCWGKNDLGQLGQGNTLSENIDSGIIRPVQIDNSGSLIDLENITKVSVGDDFSCALDLFSKVYCWGDNSRSQLGYSTTGNFSTAAEVLLGL